MRVFLLHFYGDAVCGRTPKADHFNVEKENVECEKHKRIRKLICEQRNKFKQDLLNRCHKLQLVSGKCMILLMEMSKMETTEYFCPYSRMTATTKNC